MPLFVTHEPAFRTSLQTMLRTTVSPRIGSKSLCLLSPIYLVSSCCKESTFRTSSSKFRPRGNLGYQSYRYHMQNLWIRLRRVGHAVKQSTFHLGWFRLALSKGLVFTTSSFKRRLQSVHLLEEAGSRHLTISWLRLAPCQWGWFSPPTIQEPLRWRRCVDKQRDPSWGPCQ